MEFTWLIEVGPEKEGRLAAGQTERGLLHSKSRSRASSQSFTRAGLLTRPLRGRQAPMTDKSRKGGVGSGGPPSSIPAQQLSSLVMRGGATEPLNFTLPS